MAYRKSVLLHSTGREVWYDIDPAEVILSKKCQVSGGWGKVSPAATITESRDPTQFSPDAVREEIPFAFQTEDASRS
jgi:hypothetical protein